ncbi:MAG: glutamate 5-kinase [Syntrophomonadaceae bacterium]|jgi:glutamate 5-kinase
MSNRQALVKCRRIVVKLGTSTLTHPNGQLNLQKIDRLVRELSDLHNREKEVVLVTSGAIGVGANRMGFKKVPQTIPEKQALAAIGQGALMHLYEKLFAEYGKTVAQVLLTRGDFDDHERFLNAANALQTIINLGVIPIINENDTVAVEEIKFGDNDTLSAMVSGVIDADLLIILSDVDGLYDSDPRINQDASLLTRVTEITADMEENSKTKGSSFSSGGMLTKLKAARMCMATGVNMVIANSSQDQAITRIVAGEEIGTLFVPGEERLQRRKKWIAFGTITQGCLIIDAGAEKALLKNGKSLLPSGIVDVKGDFARGNVVAVHGTENREIARGIANYSAEEIRRIAGCKTSQIESILGSKDYDEVIHRNNLWVDYQSSGVKGRE